MKLTNVSVTYSRKVNLGNYESVDATVFLSAELEELDDVETVLTELSTNAKKAVYTALQSELTEEIKVVLGEKITGSKVSEQKVVKVSTPSVWSKFVDDDDIDF